MVVVPIVLLALSANSCDESLAPAALAVRQHQLSKAADMLEAIRPRCSGSGKFHELAAIVAELNGNFTEAVLEFHQSFALSPQLATDPTILLWFAQSLIETNRSDELSSFLLKGRALPPPLLFSIGTLLAKHRDYAQAVKYLQQIPPASADDAVYFNLALAHSHLRHFEEARKNYLLAVDKHPDYVEAYLHLGLDYAASGDLRKAVPWLYRAKELAPARPDIAYALAEQLLSLAYLDSAAEVLSSALAANPHDPLLKVAQADVLRVQGDTGAPAMYEGVLATNPNLPAAHLGLALVEKARGNNVEARKHLLDALSGDPENPTTLAELGSLDAADADWSSAFSRLSKAWSLDQSVPVVAVQLARALRNLRRANEALRLLQPLAPSMHDSPAFHSELAQIYDQLGKATDAASERGQITALRAQSDNAIRFEAPKTYVH